MIARKLGVFIGLTCTLSAGAAFAESPKGTRVMLLPIVISGRVQKPMATVEVARIEPKIALTEIVPPFAERIERAVAHDPY